ncbi:Protein mab-21-like 2 [Holothuria leucospilota]|uniref:Protein mab-21-like 2 n=1 Tax=Holothuria leucospilota TaxID=206669 RepID=A0A9Q1BE71_HOLLE|nr:Protein mab-21-like 2 [Holothuria leucospilota]
MADSDDNKKDPRPSLSNILQDYVDETISCSKKVLQWHQEKILNRVVNPILSLIGDFDDRFHAQLLNAGSCYVGLLHSKPYEFDAVVKLPHLTSNKALGPGDDFPRPTSFFIDSSSCDNPYVNKLPGFGYLVVNEDKTLLHNLLSDRDDVVNSDKILEKESFVCPKKVMSVFYKSIQRAVQVLEEKQWWEEEPSVFEVKVKKQDPSVTVTAFLTGEVFTVHLLPGIPFSDNWPETLKQWGPSTAVRPNAWLTSLRMREVMEDFVVFPGQSPADEDPRLWAMCFYYSEKKLCKAAEQQSTHTIHKEARLALEALCVENEEAFYPINPRILRIIFLHQCMQFPHEEDWLQKKLGRAFVDLFLAVISATKSRDCPHFFIPTLNMFGNFRRSDLKQVSRHLRAILNNILENPEKSNFFPKRRKVKKVAL